MTVGVTLASLLVGSSSVLSAGLAFGQAEPAAETVPIAVEDLPSVDEVMALHLDGIGGEAAVRAVTSRRFTGRVTVYAQGQAEPLQVGRLEMMAKAPGTLVQDMVFPGRSSVRTVVQDGVVWQLDEDEKAAPVDESSAARQLVSARFYQLADWEAMFSELRVVGGLSQGGRRAVQLEATHLDGRTEVYTFDLDSGLLLLISGERPSPVDSARVVPFRRAYEDYREVDGVLYPHRVVEQVAPVIFEIQVSAIETGVDVPTFEVPVFDGAEGGDGE